MKRIQKVQFLLFALAMQSLCITLANAGISNGQLFKYDGETCLQYIDHGELKDGKVTILGDYPEFVVHINEMISTISLKRTSKVPITNNISLIEFKDSSHIWVISRLGPRLNGAILLNIATSAVEEKFWGTNFSLSEDKQNISFSYPDGENSDSLFVNTTMIYPSNNIKFLKSTPEGMEDSTGRLHHSYVRGIKHTMKAYAPIAWSGKTIQMLMTDNNETDGKRHFYMFQCKRGVKEFSRTTSQTLDEQSAELFVSNRRAIR